MIGYKETEIPAPKRSWVWELRNMTIGEERPIDKEDVASLRASITQYMHNKTCARFRVRKTNGEYHLKRVEDAEEPKKLTGKKVKTYTKNQVIELIKKYSAEACNLPWFDSDEDWIEQNL